MTEIILLALPFVVAVVISLAEVILLKSFIGDMDD